MFLVKSELIATGINNVFVACDTSLYIPFCEAIFFFENIIKSCVFCGKSKEVFFLFCDVGCQCSVHGIQYEKKGKKNTLKIIDAKDEKQYIWNHLY